MTKPKVLDCWMHGDNSSSFGIELLDKNNKHILDLPLVKLLNFSGSSGSENSLREGRFECYTNDQPFKVIIKPKNIEHNGHISDWFKPILEWLAEYKEKWSLNVIVYDINNIEFEFGFADLSSSILFLLNFE